MGDGQEQHDVKGSQYEDWGLPYSESYLAIFFGQPPLS